MTGALGEVMKKAGGTVTSEGKVSSTRIATLASVFTVLTVYVAHNIMALINGKDYVDFPSNSVMVLLVMVGAKVGQHVSEQITKKGKPEEKVITSGEPKIEPTPKANFD